MGLLFTLSLIPFTTAWMGENHFDNIPVAAYSANMLLCGFAFFILQRTIMAHYTHSTKLIEALKNQEKKAVTSTILYSIALISSLYYPLIAGIAIVAVAVLWVIPDKEIEKALKE